jgi:hypothetical protein
MLRLCSTEHTEDKPAPRCHCEERSDEAISTAGNDMNFRNKGYFTAEHAEHPARPPAATRIFLRRDAEAQRSEKHNHLSHPASLRLCARHSFSDLHHLRGTPFQNLRRKTRFEEVVVRRKTRSPIQLTTDYRLPILRHREGPRRPPARTLACHLSPVTYH